ncbi:hypothetical protein J4437_05900 [Candidatus Woesearchaeota archaeon]|nr:hypothetical protein [Candidatus Woesearchaeota archaeon]
MKPVTLNSEQVFVTGEFNLQNIEILKIYHRIFEQNLGSALPPVIVIQNNGEIINGIKKVIEKIQQPKRWSHVNYVHLPWYPGEYVKDNALIDAREKYDKFLRNSEKVSHYLIDGNHRTAGAVLAHKSFPALELNSDEDLSKIKTMVEEGELFNFIREEISISNLLTSLTKYCLTNLEEVKTIQQRVDKLVLENQLPDYMIERYKK